MTTRDTTPAPRPKGFAALPRARVSEIAAKGGKAAHAMGKAHVFTSEQAREAGRKGGRALQAKNRARAKAAQEETES